jgi:hypothetical protein
MEVRDKIRRLVRRLIPAAIRDKTKAVIGGLGAVLEVINFTVPQYSATAQAIVGGVIAVVTYAGVYDVPNVSVDDANRGRGVPPAYPEP